MFVWDVDDVRICSYYFFRSKCDIFVLVLVLRLDSPGGFCLWRTKIFWRQEHGRRTDDGQTIVKNVKLGDNVDNGDALRFLPATT